jgi:hypothetical protein
LAATDKQESHDPAEAKDQAYLDDQEENEISGLHWGKNPADVERLIVSAMSFLVPFVVVDMYRMALMGWIPEVAGM